MIHFDYRDLSFLKNERVMNLDTCSWGRIVSCVNENIQIEVLKKQYPNSKIEIVVGKPYDILIDDTIRIQCKLRQTNGSTPFSKQIYIETTRRICDKNLDCSQTGHVMYADDEFDFIMISLVHKELDRSNPNNWSFTCIPVSELMNGSNYLPSHIPARILNQYAM